MKPRKNKLKNNLALFLITALAVTILDQLTKLIIVKNLSAGQHIPLIKNVLDLTYIRNTGAGFGILQNMNIFLIFLTILVIGIILYNYDKIPKERPIQIFSSFILGGAFGNLISRIFFGFVVDFIDFKVWPAFNVADSAITIGAAGLIIYFWKK